MSESLTPTPPSPEAVPEAMPPKKRKWDRPVWVLVITAYFLLAAISNLAINFAYFTGIGKVDDKVKTAFAAMTPMETVLLLIINVTYFMGGMSLFTGRAVAVAFFAAALGTNVVFTAIQGFLYGWERFLGPQIIGLFIEWGILLAVCWYSQKLIAKGDLK